MAMYSGTHASDRNRLIDSLSFMEFICCWSPSSAVTCQQKKSVSARSATLEAIDVHFFAFEGINVLPGVAPFGDARPRQSVRTSRSDRQSLPSLLPGPPTAQPHRLPDAH